MFSYSLPKWKKSIGVKTLNIVVTALYIVSVLPMLIIGHFNWMSADDLAQAEAMVRYLESSGNIFATFFMGFKYAYDFYLRWQGMFFANLMLRYNPCILGEKMYFLVVYEMIGLLTFGVCYFFKSLIVYGLKGDKRLANIVSMITLIIMVHSLPANGARVEAFYWYTGAVNYTFVPGIALFLVGLLIRSVYSEDKKARNRKFCWACLWSFLMGGINYMTALSMAILSVLVIVIIILEKIGFIRLWNVNEGQMRHFKLLWIPSVFNLIGFLINVMSPGNANRQGVTQGFGPIKAILVSFYYVFDFCINTLTRWEVLVFILLLIPVMWKLAGTIEHKFEHPFIFTAFACAMVAANTVPPIYALGNVMAGRLQAYLHFITILMVVLTLMYIVAWGRQKMESEGLGNESTDKALFSANMTFIMATCATVIAFGSALCVKADPYYYSWSSAVYDIANGDAITYYRENEERLLVLKDDNVPDVVLKPYSVRPELLAFDDATKDPEDWINISLAKYYGKNSVVVGDK